MVSLKTCKEDKPITNIIAHNVFTPYIPKFNVAESQLKIRYKGSDIKLAGLENFFKT